MLEIARYELANGVYTLVTEGNLLDVLRIKALWNLMMKDSIKHIQKLKEAWDKRKLSKCMIHPSRGRSTIYV